MPCECGRLECTEQVTLDLPTYAHVRSDPTRFVVLPGHEEPDVESIVEEHGGFDVVRKSPGEPAEVARDLLTTAASAGRGRARRRVLRPAASAGLRACR